MQEELQQQKQAVDSHINELVKEYQYLNECFERKNFQFTIYVNNVLVTPQNEETKRNILSHLAKDTYNQIQELTNLYNNIQPNNQ